mmetsp:Transcript_2240/g.5204  ORF Transcript_2240/g.5204 Transcript_2240/m.5204 type:complete len:324 (-) Transcript_2240:105-1076(-)
MVLNQGQLSRAQEHDLTIITQVFSSLSVCGSLFIILSFLLFPNLRKFSYRLVFWLSVSDLLNQCSTYFGSPNEHTAECFIQAGVNQFFSIASFFWTVAIAFVLRSTVIFKRADIESSYQRMHLAIWLPALLLTLVPAWKYGTTGAWCWISGDDNVGKVLRFVCYYIPLWFAIGYNGFAYISVIRYLKRLQRLAESMRNSTNQPQFEMKSVAKLGWYPLILVFCYLWGTINRIQNWVRPDNPIFWFFVIHTITKSLTGFLNSIAYGLNQSVRSAWWEAMPESIQRKLQKPSRFYKFEMEMGSADIEDEENMFSTDTNMSKEEFT